MTDTRSNKAIAVSGCILHQSLMAKSCETSPATISAVTKWASKNEIGLIPWMCPETIIKGLPRKTQGIEKYRAEGFSEKADKLARPFVEYLSIQVSGGVEILAIVGVSFSPACSARRQAYHKNEQGLYIQALTKALAEWGLDIPVVDLNRKKEADVMATLDKIAGVPCLI